jgi:hypothetical protein
VRENASLGNKTVADKASGFPSNVRVASCRDGGVCKGHHHQREIVQCSGANCLGTEATSFTSHYFDNWPLVPLFLRTSRCSVLFLADWDWSFGGGGDLHVGEPQPTGMD